jgi:putative flavoprotein involved in K+ transport
MGGAGFKKFGGTMESLYRPQDRYDVVVIGGGQAGLAIGHRLAQQGRRFTILEAKSEPGASWRTRWDSLTLFTPTRYNSLPGLPFPGDPDSYPLRDQVVDYLAEYARHFELPIELNSRVKAVRQHDDSYVVQLADRDCEADQVVVATGPFQRPFVPALAADLDPGVVQLHSVEYRNPEALPEGPVLVVGGGNTGFQIAAELAATREVHLSIGSRQMPLPQRLLGRDLFRWLEATGLMRRTVDSRIGKRMKDRDTLIGSTPRSARRLGIQLHRRTTAASGSGVTFADGAHATFDTVIWATGYRLDHSWIDAPIFDADGRVQHRRGVTDSRGLYFVGLPWQHTRGSALLGWVKDDAEYVAAQIDAVARPRTAAEPAAHAPPETAAQRVA